MEDVEFNKRLEKIKMFENDLKGVFDKHKVTLKNGYEAWHGGSKDIIEVYLDGEHWINYDLDEILINTGVIS